MIYGRSLRSFPTGRRAGCHTTRTLDAGYRLRMPELEQLDGFDGHLEAALRRSGWELRPARTMARTIRVANGHRVPIPAGIRRQLGIDRHAVVSLALDTSRVVVWSSTVLDSRLEAEA